MAFGGGRGTDRYLYRHSLFSPSDSESKVKRILPESKIWGCIQGHTNYSRNVCALVIGMRNSRSQYLHTFLFSFYFFFILKRRRFPYFFPFNFSHLPSIPRGWKRESSSHLLIHPSSSNSGQTRATFFSLIRKLRGMGGHIE